MKSLLLHNKFKSLGTYLLLGGIFIWTGTQLGLVKVLLPESFHSRILNVILLSSSFFSALIGFYFTVFSKEAVEDEFIISLRLLSFQISSFVQFFYFLISFILMFIFKIEPRGDGGMVNFLLLAIVIYWIVYLVYFQYNLRINSRDNEE